MALEELEDFTVRPHSAGSVLRTFVGVHLRRLGGWISAADLVELCSPDGSTGGTRSALSRLKAKGLLQAETRGGRAGYWLATPALPMLERGDRRIFDYRRLDPQRDGWVLAVFSMPDAERRLRHQLRLQLIWLGYGMVSPGTWIGAGHLLEETHDLLAQHGLREYVTLLRSTELHPPEGLATAAAQWWDFDALGERYRAFIAAHAETERAWDGSDRTAFAEHLRLIDDWRAIPYLDPGLPPELTPPGWIGHRGIELFQRLQAALGEPAARHVDTVVARTDHSVRPDPA